MNLTPKTNRIIAWSLCIIACLAIVGVCIGKLDTGSGMQTVATIVGGFLGLLQQNKGEDTDADKES